jgi:phage portal protein BeeE
VSLLSSLMRRTPPVTAIEVVKDRQASPANLPNSGAGTAAYVWDGKVPVQNARVYRHWAKSSEWVRGAITIRRAQVSSAEWDIVPYDQRQPHLRRQAKAIKDLLQTPNPANDSYRSFIEPVTDDLLTLDAGCIEKVRDLTGALRELWPVNAEHVRVNAMWDGNPKQARYFWYPDGYNQKAAWRNEDFIYMMMNPRTDMPIGLPPLETLRATVEAEMAAHEYNRRQVENAAPDGIINLGEGFTEPQVNRFREFFESEVAGRGPLGFIGGSKAPSFIKFRDSNRDQQFLEWQIYLVRKIAVVFGVTPQDLGVTFDINRSTSEIQLQVSEDRGLRPLMSAIQEYITEEIVWDKAFGGPANNLAFRFTALNLKESTAKAAIYEKALAGVPWRYINEARVDEGREPIPEMEGKLVMETPQGALDISDVPTVREYLEMQMASKQAPPPSPSKSLDELFIEKLPSIIEQLRPAPVVLSEPVVQEAVPFIAEGAIKVEVPIYQEGANQHYAEGSITYQPQTPTVVVSPPEVHLEAPQVTVKPADVEVDLEPLRAELATLRAAITNQPVLPVQPSVIRIEAARDSNGRIVKKTEFMSDGSIVEHIVERDAEGRITGTRRSET